MERLEEEEGAKAQDRAQAGRLGLGAKFVSHNNATMSIVAGTRGSVILFPLLHPGVNSFLVYVEFGLLSL